MTQEELSVLDTIGCVNKITQEILNLTLAFEPRNQEISIYSSYQKEPPPTFLLEDYLCGSSEIQAAVCEVYKNHSSWKSVKKFLKRKNISIDYDPSNRPRVRKSALIAYDPLFKEYFAKKPRSS